MVKAMDTLIALGAVRSFGRPLNLTGFTHSGVIELGTVIDRVREKDIVFFLIEGERSHVTVRRVVIFEFANDAWVAARDHQL